MERKYKYKAFLSYSHDDQAWAKWLHERLERYRIPRSLRRSRESSGYRLGLVFKDREELATSHSLSESICRALDDSEYLIVVSSTDSATSRWVNEEVRHFLETRGPENLILVIPPHESAVDAPLLNVLQEYNLEPIEADARAHADGQSRALRKVIAALLSVSFDDLQQRDKTRTRKRILAVALSGFVLLVFVSVLTVKTQHSSEEASAQRAQAAELANYLVDDLSSRLTEYEEVGTLDEGLARALNYFEPIDPGQMDAEMIENYRTALNGVGSVRIRQGKPEEALDVFRRAETISLEIVSREEDNAERWLEQSISTYYIGEAYWEMQDVASASQHIEKSVDYAQKALDLSPNEFKYQREVILGLNNLGAVNARLKNWQRAEEFSLQALEMATLLITSDSLDEEQKLEILVQEVEAVSWLSEITQVLGRFDEAFGWHQQEIQLRKTLIDETDNMHHRARLVDALGYYSMTLESVGRMNDQARALEEAIKISDVLIRNDPGNINWRRRKHFNQANLGSMHIETGRIQEAEALLDEAEYGLLQIVENEGTTIARFELSFVYSTRADLVARNDKLRARALLQQSFNQLSKSIDESSVHPIALGNFIRSVIINNSVNVLDGKSPDLVQISRALDLLGPHEPGTTSAYDTAKHALLFSARNDHELAEPLISYLESIGYKSAFYLRMLQITDGTR